MILGYNDEYWDLGWSGFRRQRHWSYCDADEKPAARKKAGKYEVKACNVPVPVSFELRQHFTKPPTFSTPLRSSGVVAYLPRSNA